MSSVAKPSSPIDRDRCGRPKVLYLLTSPISNVLVRGQLDDLHRQGFDIEVGVGASSPSLPDERWDHAATIHRLPYRREISLRHDLTALAGTVRLIRRVRPEIVNASTPKAGLLGMVAAWACRVPVRVLVVRGSRFESLTGWRRRLMIGLDRLATRCATVVVFNSSSLRDTATRYRAVAGDAGTIVASGSGNGVDTVRFSVPSATERADARAELGLDESDRVIGFVGRLTVDKGIGDLVTAFEQVSANRARYKLVIVGDPEAGDPLDADVLQRIAANQRIVHMGWVADSAATYRAIDVLAFPSAREGLPNAPLEAAATGVPTVGYAATGTVDAVENEATGILVPVGDITALGRALTTVLDDDELRDRLARQALAHVTSRFDRHRVWNALASLYRSELRRVGSNRPTPQSP